MKVTGPSMAENDFGTITGQGKRLSPDAASFLNRSRGRLRLDMDVALRVAVVPEFPVYLIAELPLEHPRTIAVLPRPDLGSPTGQVPV